MTDRIWDKWESVAIAGISCIVLLLIGMLVLMIYNWVDKTYIHPPEERFSEICSKHTLDSGSYKKCMIQLYVAEESRYEM